MIKIREYVKAESLEEAWELNQKRTNKILGGMLWLRMGKRNVQKAIDLSGLGLDTIEETDKGKDYLEYYCKEFREDVDVRMESKIPALSEFYRKIGNEASFEKVPVVAATFNLGVYTWLWLFTVLALLYRRDWKRLIVMAPFTGYFLTNLLGPVVKMRYHYPFIACAPLLLYLLWSSRKRNVDAGGKRTGTWGKQNHEQ